MLEFLLRLTKMRKSLGDKRKTISEHQAKEIVELYAGFTEGEQVKIFPAIALEPEAQIKLLDALGRFRGTVFGTEAEARQTVVDVLYEAGLSKPAHQKPVLAALAVRDPEAPVIKNRAGESEPDPELRDNENVPLPSVRVHFEADVTARLAATEYRQAVESYVETEASALPRPTLGRRWA